MALADVPRCKRYLRIPVATTVYDTLIGELLVTALAMIETFLGRAIEGEDRTFGAAGGWPTIRSLRGTGDGTSVTRGTASGNTVTVPSLDTLPDYDDRIEAVINQAIVDTVAAYYQERAPTASSESEGGGVGAVWDTNKLGASGLPLRVERTLQQFRA